MMVFVNPWVFLFWLITSWVIALLGRDTRFGFAGTFLVSFIFSPIVGVIVLLASDRQRRVPHRGR